MLKQQARFVLIPKARRPLYGSARTRKMGPVDVEVQNLKGTLWLFVHDERGRRPRPLGYKLEGDRLDEFCSAFGFSKPENKNVWVKDVNNIFRYGRDYANKCGVEITIAGGELVALVCPFR